MTDALFILTVPRVMWTRGQEGSSLVDRRTGRSDILGHYFLAIGYSKESLIGKGTPYSSGLRPDERLGVLTCDASEDPEFAWTWRHRIVDELMYINDDTALTEGSREQQLIDLFHDVGVDLIFV